MQSIRSLVLKPSFLNQITKRFAGGGGRPGGKPTFNWKERRQLGLAPAGTKAPRMRSYGDEWEMRHIITEEDLANTIKLYDVNDTDPQPFEYTEELIYDKKIIPVTSLFGPHKYRGAIFKKFNYQNKKFSHQRIFGVKNPNKRRHRYGNKPHHYNNKSNSNNE